MTNGHSLFQDHSIFIRASVIVVNLHASQCPQTILLYSVSFTICSTTQVILESAHYHLMREKKHTTFPYLWHMPTLIFFSSHLFLATVVSCISICFQPCLLPPLTWMDYKVVIRIIRQLRIGAIEGLLYLLAGCALLSSSGHHPHSAQCDCAPVLSNVAAPGSFVRGLCNSYLCSQITIKSKVVNQ